MGSRQITFLWLWPATDNEPHCQHVTINKIWRRTESTPRGGWWRSHMAGIYSDCRTREIIIIIILIMAIGPSVRLCSSTSKHSVNGRHAICISWYDRQDVISRGLTHATMPEKEPEQDPNAGNDHVTECWSQKLNWLWTELWRLYFIAS